ncbi:uncharacterized protein LOC130806446 [Amaranthus tricolor]|uniref:uncharacterized protein LOC130806446 n=1 Tax=Amaranthus tricolor TaxID=29722 RepID=UPI00258389FF|nr:uncharacterized protein LOC130806446 [Amaranthus tricolor]
MAPNKSLVARHPIKRILPICVAFLLPNHIKPTTIPYFTQFFLQYSVRNSYSSVFWIPLCANMSFEQQVKERAQELKNFFKKGANIVGSYSMKGWDKIKLNLHMIFSAAIAIVTGWVSPFRVWMVNFETGWSL